MDMIQTQLYHWLGNHFMIKVAISLLLTVILCGIIGLEREHIHRPAGVRTHLLVGLSSCLIMLTSEFLVQTHPNGNSIDITRLGAQVISGIGFLGAGTIIKEGYSVKGLTTAASLWSVACIGLAVGSGFFFGSILLTIIIVSSLIVLRRFVNVPSIQILIIHLQNVDTAFEKIQTLLEDYHLFIHNIEITSLPKKNKLFKIKLSLPPELNNLTYVVYRINQMEGVKEAHVE